MHSCDINLKNISKIEGHTNLDLKVRQGRVVSCKLKIDENRRFFKEAVEGKSFEKIPSIMSRICGTCSSAHVLASIEAIEKGFGVGISEQTKRMRDLLINANHLRDHAMHLFFFVLPDIFGIDSVLDFGEELHGWIHKGLDVKEAGNFLSVVVGGRAVHPPNAVLGGFTKIPSKEETKKAIKKLEDSRKSILELIDLISNTNWKFERKTNYAGLVNENYGFLEGKIKTAFGSVIEESDFKKHLEEVILPYSTASAFEFESKEFMVGALARLNLNKNFLHPNTKKDAGRYIKKFPSFDIFNNNLAQAIEMLNITDRSIDLLKKGFTKEKPIRISPRKCSGVGVIEAPRGTLYYRIDFNEKGIVKKLDLCIPTQQNIIHMQESISRYVESILHKSKKEIGLEIEKMIRAYDPCMSCATHFLKVNWI